MLQKKLVTFVSFFGLAALFSSSAFAQGVTAAADNSFSMFAWFALAAALAIGLAAFGGAFAQGRAAATALEGIARNPGAAGKLLTPLILGLALIESLVIYAFVIAILIVNKIPAEITG